MNEQITKADAEKIISLLGTLSVDVTQIKTKLLGNEQWGMKGMIQQVSENTEMLERHDEELKEFEKLKPQIVSTIKEVSETKIKVKGAQIGFGAALAFGGAGVYKLIEYLSQLFHSK